jgi:hypothetical protein
MKKLLFLLSALVATLVSSVFVPIATAKADLEDYVAESYLIEFSESEVKLPVPNVPNGWAYSITLKSGETVLGKNVTEYLFTQTGEYTLVYSLHKDGSLLEVTTETAILRIADFTAPTINIEGYDAEYFLGETLVIQSAKVEDNDDKDLTAIVELYFGEEKIDVQSGSYAFEKIGPYKLIYKATDSAGNEGDLVCELAVLQRASNVEKNDGPWIYVGVGAGATVVLVAAFCTVLIIKKKQNKK